MYVHMILKLSEKVFQGQLMAESLKPGKMKGR